MLSATDMAILGALALLLFGPDQLPRVARKAGSVMRDLQNTSQTFIREMERAADAHEAPDAPKAPVYDAAAWDPISYEPPAPDPAPPVEHAAAPVEEPKPKG